MRQRRRDRRFGCMPLRDWHLVPQTPSIFCSSISAHFHRPFPPSLFNWLCEKVLLSSPTCPCHDKQRQKRKHTLFSPVPTFSLSLSISLSVSLSPSLPLFLFKSQTPSLSHFLPLYRLSIFSPVVREEGRKTAPCQLHQSPLHTFLL